MMKYAKDFDFVKKQVNAPPPWSSERLLSWDKSFTRSVESFVSKSYWTDTGSINVFRIIGTDHPDYIGKTWLEFLQSGKRMSENLRLLEQNPDYYLTLCKREPRMVFTSLDGLNYYVSSDGNHRSCLARFFLSEKGMSQLHNLALTHYVVDWSFHNIYRELVDLVRQSSLAIHIQPESTAVSREDASGWKLDTFSVSLTIEDDKGTHHTDFQQSCEYLVQLRKTLSLSSYLDGYYRKPLVQRIREAFLRT